MSADSCQSPEQHPEDNKLVRPKVELHSLLQHAGASAQQDIFTMKEVMHYLGLYIMQKKLYDQKQQHIVHCSQDALGRVLGVDSFSVKEPRVLFAMIIKNLVAVKNQDSPPRFPEQHSQPERSTVRTTEEAESDSVSSSSERRRRRRRSGDAGPSRSDADADEEDDEEEDEEEGGVRKRRRSDSFSLTFDNSLSWCVIGGLGNGRDRHSSQSSDAHSVSNQSVLSGPVVPEGSDSDSDNFSVEFEVESIDSENYDDEDASLSGEDEVYEVTIFEADDEDSFDEDTEITVADYWKCPQCGELNPPLPRNCNRCWALRQDWLPDVSVNSTDSAPSEPKSLPPKPPSDQSATPDTQGVEVEENEGLDVPDGKRARTPVLPLSQPDVSLPPLQSASSSSSQELLLSCSQPPPFSSSSLPSSSKSNSQDLLLPSSSSLSSPSPPPAPLPDLERLNSLEARLPESCLEPCVICQSRPKNGCIVHGRTGHLMACYTCARKLKRRNKVCPVCREPIQSVVLTYFS